MRFKEFVDIGKWCDDVEKAAAGVINPALLPAERRKWERVLAELVTPGYCICVVEHIRGLIRDLEKADDQIKKLKNSVMPKENS